MTLFAVQIPMPSAQGEARHAMIERCPVEPHEFEIPAVVFFVTADARTSRELLVQTCAGFDPCCQLAVAGEAVLVGNCFAHRMAGCAMCHPLQALVRTGELAG